jgi:hypothetical protein
MIAYFKQNRGLLAAIEYARSHAGNFDALFDTLLHSRLSFVLTGSPEYPTSFEYLSRPNGLTFLAAYTDSWHARKSRQQKITGQLEIDFPIIFHLTNDKIGLILNPHHEKNIVLHPRAIGDLKSRHEESQKKT